MIYRYPFTHLSEEQTWSKVQTTQHDPETSLELSTLRSFDQIFNRNSKILPLLPPVIHLHFVHLTIKPHVQKQFFFYDK